MASVQDHREAERVSEETKRRVPEIKAQFESMTDKKSATEYNREQLPLDDIRALRQQAQQNSVDTIRAAQERYELMRAKGDGTGHERGLGVDDSIGRAPRESKEKSSGARNAVANAGIAVKEKIVAAKNAAVESSIGVAHSAGEMALEATDRAAAVGWTAAHYTTEKAVDGTKAAAQAVLGVAEYGAELASKPLGAVKQAADATSESLKEYTYRKKEEARREVESRSHHSPKVEGEEDAAAEVGSEARGQEQQQKEGGGVFAAIGETIKEIAQTTQEMVLGQHREEQNDPAKELR